VPQLADRLQVRLSTNGASTNVGETATSVGDFQTLLLDINPTYTLTGYPSAWTRFTVPVTGIPSLITGRLAFRYFVENGGPSGTNSDFIGIDTVQYSCCGANVSGTALYCSNPVPGPVPNVTLTVTGDAATSVLTDSSGNYQFPSLVSDFTYTVTPSKAALAPGSAGINTPDVVATQRQFLGLGTPLSGCRLTAADVNGSGGINTSDVIAIQRFFLGMTNGIANVGKYKFSPASRTYQGVITDQPGQDYDTLVLGDVAFQFVHRPEGPVQDTADNGVSVSALSGLNTGDGEVPATVATLSLPNVAVDAFVTNFVLPVTTSTIDARNKLVGFQGDFSFDERVVTFESDEPVQNAGLTAGDWNVSGNVLPGAGPIRTLRVSAYSNDFIPLSGSGTLFELDMVRVSKAAQSTQLIWAAPPDNFMFIDADLNTQRPGYAAPGSVNSSTRR
jgi:hypothetical protein